MFPKHRDELALEIGFSIIGLLVFDVRRHARCHGLTHRTRRVTPLPRKGALSPRLLVQSFGGPAFDMLHEIGQGNRRRKSATLGLSFNMTTSAECFLKLASSANTRKYRSRPGPVFFLRKCHSSSFSAPYNLTFSFSGSNRPYSGISISAKLEAICFALSMPSKSMPPGGALGA